MGAVFALFAAWCFVRWELTFVPFSAKLRGRPKASDTKQLFQILPTLAAIFYKFLENCG